MFCMEFRHVGSLSLCTAQFVALISHCAHVFPGPCEHGSPACSHILGDCDILQCSGHLSSVQQGTVNISLTVASHENVRQMLERQPRTLAANNVRPGLGGGPAGGVP